LIGNHRNRHFRHGFARTVLQNNVERAALVDMLAIVCRRQLLAAAPATVLGLMLSACRTTRTMGAVLAGSSLRSLADARGVQIGAAVQARYLMADPTYAEVLAREFSIIVPENDMKFAQIHPRPDLYAFENADAIVGFARGRGMKVRGHTLVWHRQVPAWITPDLGRERLLAEMRDHIATVVGRYRGTVVAWDVVNEAIDDRGGLRPTIWSQGIGPDYVEHAFRFARDADPTARMYYNDYGAEGVGAKSDAVFGLVRDLKKKGVPIDGVGLQMHIGVQSPRAPTPTDLASNVGRLAGLGLDVTVTEMDVRLAGAGGTFDEKLARQAAVYREVLAAALSAPNLRAVLFWGFTDKHSWIPATPGQSDGALPFDDLYRPKPAYRAIGEALAR
jgi:endo-1,4-beta-xylanase